MTAIGVSEWLDCWQKTSGIYAITHRESGRMYIGSAINLRARMQKHLWHLARRSHHSGRLQNAFNKYGAEAFDRDVIEYVDEKTGLIQREQVWIDFFRPFYNITLTAGSSLGVKRSEAYKAAMSAAKRGIRQSDEARAKKSVAAKGRPKSLQMRQRLSASRKGIVFSAETRARMSASAKLRFRAKDALGRYA